MLPLTLAYTVAVYWIFRGRVRDDEDVVTPALAAVTGVSSEGAPRHAGTAERAVDALSIGALLVLSLRNVIRRRP